MADEIYMVTRLPGARASVFHKEGDNFATLTIGSEGQMAVASFSIFLNPDQLEKLATDLLAASRAVDKAMRRAA